MFLHKHVTLAISLVIGGFAMYLKEIQVDILSSFFKLSELVIRSCY